MCIPYVPRYCESYGLVCFSFSFFPLVLAYIIIGVLINRYGRGIESIPELLPNHSFWADFPFLVKDGIVFTGVAIKSGCSSLSNKLKKDGYAEI